MQQKLLKARDNSKVYKKSLPLLYSGNTQHMKSQNYKNKESGECNIIIKGKSYTFENPNSKFLINRNVNYNSKKIVYIIEYNKCKKVYRNLCQLSIPDYHSTKATLNNQKIDN